MSTDLPVVCFYPMANGKCNANSYPLYPPTKPEIQFLLFELPNAFK